MSQIFAAVLSMSLTAGYVIVFVMLLRLALKKAPKAFSYMLWAVVLFRLVCPVSFSGVFSLMPPQSVTETVLQLYDPLASPQAEIQAGNEIIVQADTQTELPQVSQPAQAVNAPKATTTQTALFVGGIVWFCGVAVLAGYSVYSLIRLKRRLKGAECDENGIYYSDKIPTAFVLGLFRPKIYLPSGLSDGEKSYIIRHEQVHIKRLDHFVIPANLLSSVYAKKFSLAFGHSKAEVAPIDLTKSP